MATNKRVRFTIFVDKEIKKKFLEWIYMNYYIGKISDVMEDAMKAAIKKKLPKGVKLEE